MDFFLHLLAVVAVSIPSVTGFNLVLGKGKILHFGPLAVSLSAAYGTFATLYFTHNWLLAVLVGFALSQAVSAFFAWLSFRLDPDGLGILSIAVHLVFLAVVLNSGPVTRGALGIPGIPRFPGLESLPAFAIGAGIVAAAWLFFLWRVNRGPVGRELAALAENEWHAQALGINRKRTHLLAFQIAGIGAFLSNFLFPQYINLLHPSDFSFANTIFFVMCVVAGLPGSVWGVAASVTVLTLLKEGLRFVPMPYELIGPVRLILFGVILIVAVYLRRKTLFPVQRSI
ncbi:MAG TPA: branched-chain amino acid ABC transporter permease [Candidatus Peribacteria bacterium]|nr:branched-chain amino acid ABC transporter permease [Candidatus Peribacteria bacterium]